MADDRAVKAHFYLGWAHFRLKAYGNALQEFEFCETNIAKSALTLTRVQKRLAQTCLKVGRKEEALRYAKLVAKSESTKMRR